MPDDERIERIESDIAEIKQNLALIASRQLRCATSEEEAMARLGVSRSTLYRLRKEGRIAYQKHGRVILYDDRLEVSHARRTPPEWSNKHPGHKQKKP